MKRKILRTGYNIGILSIFLFLTLTCTHMMCACADPQDQSHDKTFTLYQIGEIIKESNQTFIVVDEQYEAGLEGLENFEEVTVVYWFDRNDNPEGRSVLKVHPQGNPENPMRGVFATHSPLRPNLIAISQCEIISVKKNVIEIVDIDAYNHTPVLDLKN
jgi:tRNA-Thr(GGU) m(6)t(6)A37 methyltransferase TsaA